MNEIGEKTNIKLYSAISGVFVLTSAIFWLSSMFFEMKANSKDIESIKQAKREEMQLLIEIRERLIRLEEKSK